MLELPSAPRRPIVYATEANRPQPLLDADRDGGMTVTIGRLRSASEILFLLAGESKADAAARAFAAEPSPDTPASLVRAQDGRTVVILDRAAAAKLPA